MSVYRTQEYRLQNYLLMGFLMYPEFHIGSDCPPVHVKRLRLELQDSNPDRRSVHACKNLLFSV